MLPVLNSFYGPDAYEHGLRLVGKGPKLSDGREVPGTGMLVINGTIFADESILPDSA